LAVIAPVRALLRALRALLRALRAVATALTAAAAASPVPLADALALTPVLRPRVGRALRRRLGGRLR
jgi:hypothetical protein